MYWYEPMNGIIELLVICCVFVHETTMVSIGFLAQASMSLLGEINRGSPKLLHASSRSCDPRSFLASERLAQARGFSPKRDHAWSYYSPFSIPRLGEGGSPERGVGRGQCGVWLFLCSWMIGTCLGVIVMLKIWDEWLCVSVVIHGWWMMGLVWT